MKRLITSILLSLFFGAISVNGQTSAISFEALDSLQKQAARPVVVFLHAEWCNFCENMKNTTFKDAEINQILLEKFYFVSFDGESKKEVTFLGNTFKYKPTGANTGIHELAEELGTKDGMVSYPTVIYLNEKYEILYQNNGFLSAKKLKKMLNRILQ